MTYKHAVQKALYASTKCTDIFVESLIKGKCIHFFTQGSVLITHFDKKAHIWP